VLGTVRIPIACIAGSPGFSFGTIKSLEVAVKAQPGALAFGDFQIVGP
jgi:hypothetical protein